jgi:type III pantothenate kinase
VSYGKGGKMLLAIDVGNTNITYAIFKKTRLLRKGKLRTNTCNYLSPMRVPFPRIEAVMVSSVVPSVTAELKRQLRQKYAGELIILGENYQVPIKNRYSRPQQVGQDRLVNAYAGYKLYGAGLIILDFGTALTFDIVSLKGEYLGGMIFPGLRVCLESLCERAALLPKKIDLLPPRKLIGKNTVESLRSGIYYGFSGLSEKIIHLLRRQLGRNYRVLITGGDMPQIQPFLHKKMGLFSPDLSLNGLMLIYENKQKEE